MHRWRLEKVLGEKPDAPVDRSLQDRAEETSRRISERREKVAAAGGQLVNAALQLAGELIAGENRPAPDPETVTRLRDGLSETIERDESGGPRPQITLPDDLALGQFAESLARLLISR